MKTISVGLTICLALFVIASCSDLFEPDISRDKIMVLTPLDSATILTEQVIFWWEPLAGATKYELQLVSPSFQSISTIKADTTLIDEKFVIDLPPGNYQWRIRALNTAYATKFAQLTFESK